MLDVAPTELLLVAIVALLVIGPKDLPKAMRFVGKWVGKARGVARQFRSGFDTMVREAELEEMEKKWAEENARIMREHPVDLSLTPQAAVAPTALPSPSDTPAGDSTPADPSQPAVAPYQAEGDPEAHDAPVMVEKPVVVPAAGHPDLFDDAGRPTPDPAAPPLAIREDKAAS